LAEEQAQGIYSLNGRDLSVELQQRREHVAGVENKCATEAERHGWLGKSLTP
jgi:hypothetical protein